MNTKHVLASLLVLALAACSSGGDSGTPPVNEAPVVSFATAAIAVVKGVPVDLIVNASDPDSDPLTITWEITGGTPTTQTGSSKTFRWTPPGTAGAATVSIRVTDGNFTRNVTAVIKVGTLLAALNLPSPLTKANSPYIISPSDTDPKVIARANFTTTIEPGVELLINTANAYISVLGELEAHGTEGEPIVIKPNNRFFNCGADRGWWEGIRAASDDAVSSDGFVDLEHVEIWDAKWGVRLRDNASALVRDCKIRCSATSGLLIEGNGFLSVFDSRISDGLGDGIAISAVSSLPDSVRIEGCAITINGDAGIRMDLQDNSQAVPIIVEFNSIEFNGTHGISLANAVFPSIHHNAFRGNGESSVSNIFLTSGYPDPVNFPNLDATCNFWGSAAGSQATIDASIRDILDTSTVHSRVISCPWLNASPITTTPNCTMVCP